MKIEGEGMQLQLDLKAWGCYEHNDGTAYIQRAHQVLSPWLTIVELSGRGHQAHKYHHSTSSNFQTSVSI